MRRRQGGSSAFDPAPTRPWNKMTTKDHDTLALEQAMEIACRDPQTKVHIEEMLEHNDWREVAEFAAFACQSRSLNVQPWEAVPSMNIDPDGDDPRYNGARKLLRRMLANGVSRYHPDPLAALSR